jgi:hypothetical protein
MNFVISVIIGSQSIKKCVMNTLFTRKLKIFSTNLEHVIFSRVMTIEIKVFGKFEVYEFYNYLLCVIIVQFFSKSITYSKVFFS